MKITAYDKNGFVEVYVVGTKRFVDSSIAVLISHWAIAHLTTYLT